jgi:hypothetical protein
MATNYTLDMLATLQEAIATGTRSVYYGDKRVDYRSLDEMIRIQNMMLIALGLATPCDNRKYAEFTTGINRPFGCFPEGGFDLDPYFDDGFFYPWF